ncbi:MAG: DnaJ domain-containing protein [Acidobacteriia bacterium]|nr:DnaJ domain-containing protein [Terriglobia bacterium]
MSPPLGLTKKALSSQPFLFQKRGIPYPNRGQSGWGEHAHGDAGARRSTARGKMTEKEAYEILGLQPGASADAITSAHRTLMKKFHPDQGGTTEGSCGTSVRMRKLRV